MFQVKVVANQLSLSKLYLKGEVESLNPSKQNGVLTFDMTNNLTKRKEKKRRSINQKVKKVKCQKIKNQILSPTHVVSLCCKEKRRRKLL